MVKSFRSALLVIFALSASTVAPAQVRPAGATEPLIAQGTNQLPALIVPATLSTPELPVTAQPSILDTDPVATDLPAPTRDRVTPHTGGDFNALVASMRGTSAGSSELECLAGAIYFESKSEPLKGQLAVGHVIANRAASGRFPSSYCGVVYQRSQFSFVRGHSMPPIARSGMQWKNAVAIARIVDQKLSPTPVAKALFFHARRVSPGWRLTRVATLGNHVFYR